MKQLVIAIVGLVFLTPQARTAEPAPLRGYSSDSARAEREWEAKFRAIPDPATLRA